MRWVSCHASNPTQVFCVVEHIDPVESHTCRVEVHPVSIGNIEGAVAKQLAERIMYVCSREEVARVSIDTSQGEGEVQILSGKYRWIINTGKLHILLNRYRSYVLTSLCKLHDAVIMEEGIIGCIVPQDQIHRHIGA